MPASLEQVIQSSAIQFKKKPNCLKEYSLEAEPIVGTWVHVFYKGHALLEKAVREWGKQDIEAERVE